MKTYVDMIFTPESADPAEVVTEMEKVGITPIFGVHDLVIQWENEDEFRDKFTKVKSILKHLKISYRLITTEDNVEPRCPYF